MKKKYFLEKNILTKKEYLKKQLLKIILAIEFNSPLEQKKSF